MPIEMAGRGAGAFDDLSGQQRSNSKLFENDFDAITA
jgi:hypothetical protein